MIIKKAEFIKGILGTDDILFNGKKQIAFVGRSNVGKSSLINFLLNQKISKTSKTQGKTKEINFFLINDDFYFVDLPGYGYAKLSKKDREKLAKHIFWYLNSSEVKTKKVVIIVDAVVGITEFDELVMETCEKLGRKYVIVGNKIDKLNQKDFNSVKKRWGEYGVLWVSVKKKKGLEGLWSGILK